MVIQILLIAINLEPTYRRSLGEEEETRSKLKSYWRRESQHVWWEMEQKAEGRQGSQSWRRAGLLTKGPTRTIIPRRQEGEPQQCRGRRRRRFRHSHIAERRREEGGARQHNNA